MEGRFENISKKGYLARKGWRRNRGWDCDPSKNMTA